MQQIVVAIIGIAGTVVTLVYNKQKELKIQQRNLKEEKYIMFLKSLIDFKAGIKEAKSDLTETLQIIYLIGSNDVIEKTSEFIQLMIDKDKVSKTQDELYKEMVKAMRKDLYGKKYYKKFHNKLAFVIFQ